MSYTLHNGDCLEYMKTLPAQSVDAILTDLPYGTTACAWDTVIPFDDMWKAVKHVLKPDGAFVTTASQPFTSLLVCSNLRWFRYEWIWEKGFGKEPFAKNKRPMKSHENVCVFYKIQPKFNAQRTKGKPYTDKRVNQKIKSKHYIKDRIGIKNNGNREPISVIYFLHGNQNQTHPTQKPVALYEYLVQTYTNPGDTVLDMCMGSGTTGVACIELGRDFVGCELDPEYFQIAERRIEQASRQGQLFGSPANKVLQRDQNRAEQIQLLNS